MTRFEPFRALRYDTDRLLLGDVISPPYDVVNADDQARLQARSAYNAIRLEAGRDSSDPDSYRAVRHCLDAWIEEGMIVVDDEPGFSIYSMGYRRPDGSSHQVTGLLGAMALDHDQRGDVLPHEATLRSPARDRLELLRACRANLSPIWGLSLAEGLSTVCQPEGPPLARATDDQGVHHRVWRITSPARLKAITELVATAPVVLADGHHRYQTALSYRREVVAAGSATGAEDLVLTFLVELVESQLDVRAIHRVVTSAERATDVVAAVSGVVDLTPVDAGPAELLVAMERTGSLGLLTPGGAFLVRPRQGGEEALDVEVAEELLGCLGPHETTYEADPDRVSRAVASGQSPLAVLVRPVAIGQLRQVADAGLRFPQKTTYFTPKPATGIAFRSLDVDPA